MVVITDSDPRTVFGDFQLDIYFLKCLTQTKTQRER